MNRMLTGSISLLGGAALAAAVFVTVPVDEGTAFCSCPSDSAFDHSLPLSHPINRCAAANSSDISWSAWFSGSVHGYQFHYLDLLELLSRVSDEPTKAPHQS